MSLSAQLFRDQFTYAGIPPFETSTVFYSLSTVRTMSIEQCVQKVFAKKRDKINEKLDLLDSKVFDLERKTDKYQNEVCDIKEIIDSEGELCHQTQSHINVLEQYSRRNSMHIFGIEK